MADSIPLVHTGEDQIGGMCDEIWQGMHDILLEQGILSGPMELNEVYSMQFLQSIHGTEP